MGNINNPNDPYYMSQPGWDWDAARGRWINVDAPGARSGSPADQQRAPAPAARTGSNQAPKGGSAAPGVQQSNYNYSVNPSVANFDQTWTNELGGMLSGLKGRAETKMGTEQADQTREVQTGLISDLQAQANGTAPSVAQAQLQKASDQNLSNTLAAIQSTRGMGATAAAGSAIGAGAAAGQQMAQDSAILRLQEQMQARGLLGQIATGTRGQDIGQAAQLADVALRDRAQTDAIKAQLIAQGMSFAQAEQEARLRVAQMNQQGSIAATAAEQGQQQITNQKQQMERQQSAQETQFALNFFMNLLKTLAGAGGGAAGAGAVTG